jgi:hypothetical protein
MKSLGQLAFAAIQPAVQNAANKLRLRGDREPGANHLAPWPVHRDSHLNAPAWQPVPRKAMMKRLDGLEKWNRREAPHKHGGYLGAPALRVFRSLATYFFNYVTGQCDPSYDAIGRVTGYCRETVRKALRRLEELGIIQWTRRCTADTDEQGRFRLRQDTNAYTFPPPEDWIDYIEDAPPPLPDPETWGACPPLPTPLEQASEAVREGEGTEAALRYLELDPTDTLAAALASLGRTLLNSGQKSCPSTA